MLHICICLGKCYCKFTKNKFNDRHLESDYERNLNYFRVVFLIGKTKFWSPDLGDQK